METKTRVIFKYKLNPGVTTIEIPKFSNVLCVQAQGNEPYIWVEQTNQDKGPDDPILRKEKRHFVTYPTGLQTFEVQYRSGGINIINPDHLYIGTFQLDGGSLVYHLYEILYSQN